MGFLRSEDVAAGDLSPDVSPVLPCGREVKPPGRTEDTDDVDGSTPEANVNGVHTNLT